MLIKCIFSLSYIRIYCSQILTSNTSTTSTNTTNTTNSTIINDVTCGNFCLRCLNGNCTICDTGYYLINQACIEKTIVNCDVSLGNGVCLICSTGYYLNNQRCLAVPKANLIQNCNYYDTNLNCTLCTTGYYFASVNAQCTVVNIPIANCTLYSDGGSFCSACGSGLIPDQTQQNCISTPLNNPTCQTFSYASCSSCISGNLYDPNFYLNSLNFQQNQTFSNYTNLILGKQSILYFPIVCLQQSISNCKVYQNFFTCSTCNEQYFLVNGTSCQPFPSLKIDNCESYSTATHCTVCSSGYYKQDLLCLPVIQINNCLNYSRIASSSCLQCQTQYYLQAGSCIKRSLSLNTANCASNFKSIDFCQTCHTGFVLNSDGTLCITTTQNCRQSTVTQTNSTCIQCISGYYINNNQCIQGTLTGCDIYTSSTLCANCLNNFFLNNGVCQKHALAGLINCQGFSITSQSFCNTCNLNSILFNLVNYCAATKLGIVNCISYSAEGVCQTCNSTISYLQNNICLLGNITNCNKYDPANNICVYCGNLGNIGYTPTVVQGNTNLCQIANPNFSNNCVLLSPDNNKQCLSCAEKYYLYIFRNFDNQFCVPNNYYQFPPAPNVQNCRLFDYVNNVCLFCNKDLNDNYYVLSNNQCLETCPLGTAIMTYQITLSKISSIFFCKQYSTLNQNFVSLFNIQCFRFEIATDGNIYCAQCPSNTERVINLSLQSVSVKWGYKITTNLRNSINNENTLSFVQSCVSSSPASATSSTGTLFKLNSNQSLTNTPNSSNCRSFIQTVANQDGYHCISCNFGYSSLMVNVQGLNSYMMQSCNIMSDCSGEIYYSNLGLLTGQFGTQFRLPYDIFLSCHQCKTNGNIPTFGMAANAIQENGGVAVGPGMPGPYGIPDINSLSQTPFNTQTRITQTNCSLGGLVLSSSFPKNCGVQIVYIESVLIAYNAGTSNVNPACIACAPMYAPTMSKQSAWIVVLCTLITNCLSSNRFNQCEVCAPQFAFDITLQNTCQSSSVSNCYLMNNAVCVSCIKGYILTVDNLCDQISAFQCSVPGFSYAGFTSFSNQINLVLNGIGCETCNSNYVAVQFKNQIGVCIQNSMLQKTSVVQATSSIFINQCVNYGMDSIRTICVTCSAGYIPNNTGYNCYLGSNCQLSIGDNLCQTCAEGYYSDFSNNCIQGSILNCKTYFDRKNCASCQDNYFLVGVLGGKICFQNQGLNCLSLNPSDALNGNLNCLSCLSGFYQTTSNQFGIFPLKICMPILVTPNCIQFQTKQIIAASTMKCILCNTQYYLDQTTQNCLTRNQTVLNCQTPDPFSSSCNSCISSFYLSTDRNTCLRNPSGIVACIQFSDSNTCILCAPNYYLDGSCVPILTQNIIPNCLYYKNIKECQQCQLNFQLQNNICQQSVAANCLTYLSSTSCNQCPPSYQKTQQGQILSCVQVTIQNCQIINENIIGPNFVCSLCQIGYYINVNSTCSYANSQVTNCLYYQKDGICSQCSPPYILTNNGASCILNYITQYIDPNCANMTISYQCSSCAQKKYFQNGQCVSCPATLLNCQYCNPINPNVCLVCSSGTTMSIQGNCLGGQNTTNTNVTNTTNVTSYCLIIFMKLASVLIIDLL